MGKVKFFQSIRIKFILVFVLLILIAMQIIGVYFVRVLEDRLVDNFKNAMNQHVNILTYYIEEVLAKERNEQETTTIEQDIQSILEDYAGTATDIKEIRVINKDYRIIGTSSSDQQGLVGQRITDELIKRTFVIGERDGRMFIDPHTGHRIWYLYSPIRSNNEIIGIIYMEGKIEKVFEQLRFINGILTKGTLIALAITALLAVFVAQTITRPISDMKKQAQAMAKGNFSRKVKIYGTDEIGQLASTFNHLTKKLQDAQETTEGERRKLSSVLAYMTDGVIATDRKGRIILINEPATNMLNVTRETVLSQPIVSVLGIEDKYTFEDLLEEKDSVTLDFSTKDKPYILRANFSVIQKETGFMNGLITVLHDITEQEKIEEERREFVANVSHELRTPLTTMRSYLEALSDGALNDPEIAPKFLKVTQDETERMIRLVNDLLQLSKLDLKDYRLDKEWVNFSSFFHHIIDRFEITKNPSITFKREIQKDSIFVEIDQDKITQVLDNLISNALKYSPEGGTITCKAAVHNDELLVSISDEGVGIPKESIHRIFDRFYRVDKARTRKLGGTGLGLAIAKEMIQAHKGKIWAESQEGKGTTFYFSLPYDRTQEDDLE